MASGRKLAACGRQPNGAAGAIEQRRLDDMLEDLDLSAERRLGHIQPCRSATEVKLFGHGHETAELAQIEHRCVSGMDGLSKCQV